jgi:hypothetical protein
MELANAGRPAEAEALLRAAMKSLRRANMPMMRAKILNSLGLVFAQHGKPLKARRCLCTSLRTIAGHIGTNNWLYARIAANRDSLAA